MTRARAPRVAKPAFLEQLDLTRPTVVEASAGTGKTYLLQHLVAELVVARGVPLEKILVVTFTEKAAGELRARVRKTLRDIATAAADEDAPASTDPAWHIDDTMRARARAALLAFDRATIGTIHGVCLEVLKELGLLAGEPSLDELEVTSDHFDEAWRSVLRRAIVEVPFAPLYAGLTQQDREALAEGAKHVARARGGTVPTLDALERDVHALLEAFDDAGRPAPRPDGAHPFHEKVGAPWTRRREPSRSAYGDFARALLVVLGAHDRARDSWLALVAALASTRALLERAGEIPGEAIAAPTAFRSPLLHTLLERALPVVQGALFAPMLVLGARTRARARALHDVRGTITFDAMIVRLADALAREHGLRPSERPFLTALRQRFTHALIDEFQDTDATQWEIFRTVFLAAPGERSRRGDGTLVLVGDPKQAIYRFRGADIAAYQAAVRETVDEMGGARERMDENHRASARLLAAVYDVQRHGLFVPDDGIALAPLVARGRIDAAIDRPITLLRPPIVYDDAGAPTVLKRQTLDRHFAKGIAAEIATLLSPDGALSFTARDGRTRPIAAGDIAVLGHTRRDLDVVSRALEDAGIPFLRAKKHGLHQTSAAHDLLDLLVAVAHPSDRGALFRALATSFFAIPTAELDLVIADELPTPLADDWSAWRGHALRGDIPQLLRSIESRSRVIDRLLAWKGEREATHMRQLLEALLARHAERGIDLLGLIHELKARVHAADSDEDAEDLMRIESEHDRVRVMTMHAAKGLEAPVVFLAGGYRGMARKKAKGPGLVHVDGRRVVALDTAPYDAALAREEEMEHARLLYVAMTRAQLMLFMPWWDDRQVKGLVPLLYARLKPHLDAIVAQGGTDTVAVRETRRVRGREGRVPGALTDVERRAIRDAALPPVPPPPPFDPAARIEERRGPQMTSFTALARRASTLRDETSLTPEAVEPGPEPRLEDELLDADALDAAAREDGALDDVALDDVALDDVRDDAARDDAHGDTLATIPRGKDAGNAFHLVLETVDYAAVRDATSFAAWRAATRRDVDDVFARARFSDEAAEEAARLVFETLRRPIAAFGGARFCDVAERLHEVDFRMPIPEQSHPLLGKSGVIDDERPFRVSRGFLTGSMDVVLRHEGRVYLVDWKSNRIVDERAPTREDYSKAATRRVTDEKYRLQIEIYLVALTRFLGISTREDYERLFGGVLYVYLRGAGMPGGTGDGVDARRPSFDDVMRFEAGLLELSSSTTATARGDAGGDA